MKYKLNYKQFTIESMLDMLEDGFTPIETSLEKWELINTSGQFSGYIGNNCACCEASKYTCGNCAFITVLHEGCKYYDIKQCYQQLDILYINELLEEKIK